MAIHLSTQEFYRRIIEELSERGFRFVVGGTYALCYHAGIARPTKDLDLLVQRDDIERVLAAMNEAGYRAELRYPHWLGQVYDGARFVDIIFSSGNGLSSVDDAFFDYASQGTLFGCPVAYCPVEEMIWSKAFVMERERYDGADVAHLLHVCSERLDWQRLLRRFDEHWRVLLSHLVLFGFIYPHHITQIPYWVIESLAQRLRFASAEATTSAPVCGGTLLSRSQFVTDVRDWGYTDERLRSGSMSEREIEEWTRAALAQEKKG